MFAVAVMAFLVLLAAQSPIATPVASAQVVEGGVCDRSAPIREAIVAGVKKDNPTITLCSQVTDEHLAALETLSVDPDLRLSRPKADDLAGLTSLGSIDLSSADLYELPAGFFSDTTNVTSVVMTAAKLTTLPAGIFDPLKARESDDHSGLMTLRLDRNNFTTFPPGLATLTDGNFPNLNTLTLGLDMLIEWWHFVDLPSGWVQKLPTGIGELRLKHIGLTDAEAVWIATYLTELVTLQFSHRKMTLPKITETIEQLKINPNPDGLSHLTLAASGDYIQGCNTTSNSRSLGTLYASASQTEKDAFAAAFTDFIVDDFTIWDPTMTPEVLDVILNSMAARTTTLHFECANLEGFTGASLSKFTNLQTLAINSSDLVTADFISIVGNLGPTRVADLMLSTNKFSNIDLDEFMFYPILDTLTDLNITPYFSCDGPWISDYEAVGFDLARVDVDPEPQDEPVNCIPPTPTPVPDPEEGEPEGPIDEGARILRIEPAVKGIRVWTETDFVLSTNVYGMQDKLDNSLADRVSVDTVRFDWEDTRRSGTISETTRHARRQNSTPDDREVSYTSPRIPGTYVVKANIPHSNGCRGPRGDETEEQAEARCTAEFEIVVRYKQETETEITVAKNPSGPIPGYVMDERGRQCPVFTPEEGGSLIGDGYSITAEPGAVENETYIAICMDPIGAASNAGMTHQRYTLDGDAFSVNALNTRGQRFTNYQFVTHAEACLPLPDDLRTRISDVEVIGVNIDKSLTVLSTTLTFSGDEIQACGLVSKLPAKLAIGLKGAPGPKSLQDFETQIEEPETGGRAPDKTSVLLLFILGAAVATASVLAIGRTRDSE